VHSGGELDSGIEAEMTLAAVYDSDPTRFSPIVWAWDTPYYCGFSDLRLWRLDV